jgi:hypothetical protein
MLKEKVAIKDNPVYSYVGTVDSLFYIKDQMNEEGNKCSVIMIEQIIRSYIDEVYFRTKSEKRRKEIAAIKRMATIFIENN